MIDLVGVEIELVLFVVCEFWLFKVFSVYFDGWVVFG